MKIKQGFIKYMKKYEEKDELFSLYFLEQCFDAVIIHALRFCEVFPYILCGRFLGNEEIGN